MKYNILYYYVIIGLFFLTSNATFAQNNNFQDRLFYKSKSQLKAVVSADKIAGHPYYKDIWLKGHLLLKSGKISKEIYLKYQIFNNILVCKTNDKRKIVLLQKIDGFFLEDHGQKVLFEKGFTCSKYRINSNNLIQLIYDGRTKLLKKYEVTFRKGQQPDPLTGEIKSYFKQKAFYLLVDKNGRFHKIKLDKKNILPFLEPHKAQIKNFTYARNLSFHKVNDVRKILYEYDLMEKNDRR